jgi:hypothetical protein
VIIKTVFADLIDGPLAHLPDKFGANSAWVLCGAIAHAVAHGATLRRAIIAIPARLARLQRRTGLHLPSNWPWAQAWLRLWHSTISNLQPTTA